MNILIHKWSQKHYHFAASAISVLSKRVAWQPTNVERLLEFTLTAGIQRGGLATAFTQHFGGNVNICIPFEIQDFPKVLEQPSMDDLHRNIQGGNYAAYGSVAMLKCLNSTLRYPVPLMNQHT